MTAILGISAFYHDSAAALLVDGEVVAAAQEERFSRNKHDASFPVHAIAYCLQQANLKADEIDYIAYYEKPLRKFERLLETYLSFAPAGFRNFCQAIPLWLKSKLHLRSQIRRGIQSKRHIPVIFPEHHESHAASAFFPSPFEQAAILTVDGVGEWATTTLGIGDGNKIRLLKEMHFPHSLGLLYSAFTYYCGFRVNDGEYKLMGLAPYGQPIYRDTIYRHLLHALPDGSFRLNMPYFNYAAGLTMTGWRFHRLFGGRPRREHQPLEQRHMDLAASIQCVVEELLLRMLVHLHELTNQKNLVMAGGVALNCVANSKILRQGPFENLWIQPAAGDAGGALGAAWFAWHQLLQKPRTASEEDRQSGSYLGPSFSLSDIKTLLQAKHVPFQEYDNDEILFIEIANRLAQGKIIGWFRGRMEFGPRALGNRSILADPRVKDMQLTLNRSIKFRETFRPFAPAILEEHLHDWFDLPRQQMSPYMLLVGQDLEKHRCQLDDTQIETMRNDNNILNRLRIPRSNINAVTHIDYSARVQTVNARTNPAFHGLLRAFFDLTGCPILINTSFNVRDEPIVCTPEDALRCFQATKMDMLVLENCVVTKEPSA